jgi:hypothetical protein
MEDADRKARLREKREAEKQVRRRHPTDFLAKNPAGTVRGP